MQDLRQIRSRKRRSNRSVLGGAALMAIAMLCSARNLAPQLPVTVAALMGFVLVMYGVHVGWLVFYEREPDGPAS